MRLYLRISGKRMAEFVFSDIIILNTAIAALFLILVGCAMFLYIEHKIEDRTCFRSSLKTLAYRLFSRK